MASAGPYASQHLAPGRLPRQHLTTQVFTGRMPFLPPNQQRQSTEGNLKATYASQKKRKGLIDVAGQPGSLFSVSEVVDLTVDYNRSCSEKPASLNPHVGVDHHRGRTAAVGAFADKTHPTSLDKPPACQKRKPEVLFHRVFVINSYLVTAAF